MTSSDQTALDRDTIEASARRAGSCLVGEVDGSGSTGARVGLIASKFNGGITGRLLDGALEAFDAHGVARDALAVAWVPGAFEIPVVALRLASSGLFDTLVALGAVIRGDTAHFDFVAGACASGCREVSLSTGVPVIFGVLTTEDVEQALARSMPDRTNKGYEAALTALEVADLMAKLPSSAARVS
jgi:6,7-dimethyl-8-ribityllumazine synthase